MKLTPKQLRQIIKEELTATLIEGPTVQSPLPNVPSPAMWLPGKTTDYWQALYNVQDGVFTTSGTDRIASHSPPAPVVKFIAFDKSGELPGGEPGSGTHWNLVVSGGHRRTENDTELMSLVGNVTQRMGTDDRAPNSYQGSLVRDGIPADELAQAVDNMVVLLKNHHRPVDFEEVRLDVGTGA
jgi:hypothetical protein